MYGGSRPPDEEVGERIGRDSQALDQSCDSWATAGFQLAAVEGPSKALGRKQSCRLCWRECPA